MEKQSWMNRSLFSRVIPGFLSIYMCFSGMVRASETKDSLISRMAHVDTFAFGGIGIAGTISPGEKDYKAILLRPSAKTDFEALFTTGNLQAKCYALAALHDLNPQKFAALSAALQSSKDEVVTMQGCIMQHEPVAAVLKRIQSGTYSRYTKQ